MGPVPEIPEFHIGTRSSPIFWDSDSAPCSCPGQAVENGPSTWMPALMWKIREKLVN